MLRLYFVADGELLQVIDRAVVDVEVDIASDAIDLATIGELPKLPFAFVGELFHIVVGYPEMIAIKSFRVEIFLLKFQSSVDDGASVVVFLYDVKPFRHFAAQLLGGECAYGFDIKHWG